MAVIIVILYRT